jgi:hypothetical protein
VNMWEHGRRTDTYRGKHRILGENLSLGRQYIYTSAIWNELGFKDKAPDAGYAAWLNTLPKRTVTWFARGKNDRLVVTVRDRGRVIALPLINGGESQHMNTPYYPIPFSPGLLQGVADQVFPQLLPRITLADGAQLAPLAYAAHVKIGEQGARTTVTYDQGQLDRLGQKAPVADDRFSVKTTYVLEPGRIRRTDVFTPKPGVAVKAVDLAFASFSGKATTKDGATTFGTGDVTGFKVEGLRCSTQALNDEKAYRAPTGAMTSLTSCTSGASEGKPITVSWTISYK